MTIKNIINHEIITLKKKNSYVEFQKHHLDFIDLNQIIYASGLLFEHIQYIFQTAFKSDKNKSRK